MDHVRVRFAPSPTGYLHIGGLRTALYNYLFARQHDGEFILRIEDTDQSRFVEGAVENLINALSWAGLSYDEGVFVEDGEIVEKGDHGPYIQSKRLDRYREVVDRLVEEGHAYYCFCSKERLDQVREEQKVKGLIPRYDGFCRHLSQEEAKKRVEAGEDYVVRLKLPAHEEISFDDLVRGPITINTEDMDDQVLLKTDGFPTYHMAVVVDDHDMGITHIIRGEEWLPSTPKHVYLYEVLGWEKPTYVHLPTVLNKERKKLSKRHGDVAVEDFKANGYLPEGLVNYLALIGWSPDSNEEIFTLDELIEEFSFDRVSKTGGIFDLAKLDWVNQQYMKDADGERLAELAAPFLIQADVMTEDEVKSRYDWLVLLMDTVKESMHKVSEVVERTEFIFKDPVPEDGTEEIMAGEQVPELMSAIQEYLADVDEVDQEVASTMMKGIQKKTGIKGKNLYMPTRIALTGQQHGPDLTSILILLGKDEIVKRVENYK